MDTAQNQVNTTGGQFTYPDFSQNSGNLTPPPQPTPAPVTQPTQVSTPVPNNVATPPVQQPTPTPTPPAPEPAPKQDYIDQQKLDELKKDIDALEPKPALMYCCISII